MDPTSRGRGLERGVAPTRAWPGAWSGSSHGAGPGAGRGFSAEWRWRPWRSGAERRGGDGRAGGRQRRGSESPDRRLQPAVGPRRASAPVSGSGGAGLSSFRPSRGSSGLAAGGRAGLEGAAGCALFTGCSDSRASRAGAALHGAPRAASRSACVPGEGRASPDARTSSGSGLPFVAALRTFVI